MSKVKKIACIGEVMIELSIDKQGQAAIGVAGDTYNTAVYLQKLAAGEAFETSYITALGNDSFSDRIIEQLQYHDIATDHIEFRHALMPGLYAIDTDDKGERSFSYWRGQAAARTLFQAPCDIQLERLAAFDLIYISGITMAIFPPETRVALIAFLTEFRKNGGVLAFDSNYRPSLWENIETARKVTTALWSIADIALPSIDDEMDLYGDNASADVLRRLIETGVSYGALKRGAKGPLPVSGGQPEIQYQDIKQVVDTTAAGDSFNAGFLYEYIRGNDLFTAMQTGHSLASQVIQAKGAITDIDRNAIVKK